MQRFPPKPKILPNRSTMNHSRRQDRYLRRLQAEKGVLGKLAWIGVFSSLVAFAYYLSVLFILFGVSAFVLLASHHLKHQKDDPPLYNRLNRSEVFEYIDDSLSHDLPPRPPRFDEQRTIYATNPQQSTQSPSIVRTLRHRLDQDSEEPHQSIRNLAKVALKSFDKAYHAQDRRRRDDCYVCTHRACRWEDIEGLRECPNCRQRYDEVLTCPDW